MSDVFRITLLLIGLALLGQGRAAENPLFPFDLRCDGMVEPSGVDSATPSLSWKLRGDGNGRKQTAYRIRAASDRSLLIGDKADLWDSGRIASDRQSSVAYEGEALSSSQKVFWDVRVWDESDAVSAASEVASWTMGISREEDWGDARWIAHPDWVSENRTALGYRSLPASDVDTLKWIQLDLGDAYSVDRIRLHALRHTVSERLGFPTVFKVELSPNADMSEAKVLADYTVTPYRNSWATRYTIPAEGITGRYVRVTVPKLRDLNGEICLAFSQIEVTSGARNLALSAKVSASDSIEQGPWSLAAVVDGKGVPGSNPLGTKAALLRHSFESPVGVARATLHVAGLGQYVAYLNGQRLGIDKLSPGWTDTDKTVLYDTRDVTALIRPGSNAIGLSLASGMYSVYYPGDRYTKFEGRFRPLMALVKLEIEYVDGSERTIVSDTSWRAAYSPTTYAHVYGGEDYDARKEPTGWTSNEFDDRQWVSAAAAPAPTGTLKGASFSAPPLRSIKRLSARTVNDLAPGRTVYDFGQNASMMPRVSARGVAGSRIRISPAELIGEDGSIDRESSAHGGKDAYWEYTLRGGDAVEHWRPEFFYHGARYFLVERFAAEGSVELPEVVGIEGVVTHSSAEPVGRFSCSFELFNRIRSLVRWAQRSNMVSVLTDCPHRERLGWLEQYHLNGPSLRYEFALDRLFMKVFGDMADAQTETGLVPDIAPEYVQFEDGFRDSPEWGSALILAAWQQYLWSGDDTVFRRHYEAMKRYMAHLESKADGHILSHGLGDWYDIGPERPGLAQMTPVAVTATATYYEDAWTLQHVAKILGHEEDARRFAELSDAIRAAFIDRFFDEATGSYGPESQTGNAMAYTLGLYPEGRGADVLQAIVDDLARRGNAFTAGDVGHRYLLLALSKGGRSDLIFAMHSQSDRPGYGWQLDRGATSLTEAWDANRHSSHNHFMLGHIMEWFYGSLAGIAPDPSNPGWKNVIVRPQPVDGVDWAEAAFESVRGPVSVSWERKGKDRFSMRLTLSPNMTASVYLPHGFGESLTVNGAAKTGLRNAGDRLFIEVGSGEWVFELKQ